MFQKTKDRETEASFERVKFDEVSKVTAAQSRLSVFKALVNLRLVHVNVWISEVCIYITDQG